MRIWHRPICSMPIAAEQKTFLSLDFMYTGYTWQGIIGLSVLPFRYYTPVSLTRAMLFPGSDEGAAQKRYLQV